MADQHHQPHHQQQSHSSIRNRCYSFTQHQQQQQHHHHHSMSLPISQPQPQQQQSDSDRSSVELRAVDCNLASLCDHIQLEGFNNGVFSDIVVNAMDSTYHLHRLILSRSSYFRNMLHGPWKEASAPVLSLQIDDPNVNEEAIAISLAYLYGHHPKLNDNNAFRVLAAASFLDLQELCAICTDFIIAELWTSNFLAYQNIKTMAYMGKELGMLAGATFARGISNYFASVGRRQAKGQVEAFNKLISDDIKKKVERAEGLWDEELIHVLWAIRTTVKGATDETPFLMVYGAEAVLPIEHYEPSLRVMLYYKEANWEAMRLALDSLSERRGNAALRHEIYRLRMTRAYNKKVH